MKQSVLNVFWPNVENVHGRVPVIKELFLLAVQNITTLSSTCGSTTLLKGSPKILFGKKSSDLFPTKF